MLGRVPKGVLYVLQETHDWRRWAIEARAKLQEIGAGAVQLLRVVELRIAPRNQVVHEHVRRLYQQSTSDERVGSLKHAGPRNAKLVSHRIHVCLQRSEFEAVTGWLQWQVNGGWWLVGIEEGSPVAYVLLAVLALVPIGVVLEVDNLRQGASCRQGQELFVKDP